MRQQLPRGVHALIEVGTLFLPGILACLWPNVDNTNWFMPVQVVAYLYFLAGCLVIGRRWTWDQLGLNRRGLDLSLISGAVLIPFYLWKVYHAPIQAGRPI
jgi:hypothetical protein